jgi:hypothetical protein
MKCRQLSSCCMREDNLLNAWLFFWLLVFAVIGVLCLSSGFLVTGLLIYFAQKHDCEIKAARDAEYEEMKKSLLHCRFDAPG